MKKLDPDKVALLKNAVESNPERRKKPYGSATAIGVPKNGSGMPMWEKIMGSWLMDYLTSVTYPYDKPIILLRGNLYEEGTFFNLHIDNTIQSKDDFLSGIDNNLHHITSITLDKSDDLEGGEIIIGDCWDLWDTFELKPNMNRKPLQIINPDVGECVYWDWNTLHGITEIKKGTRLSLVVVKKDG